MTEYRGSQIDSLTYEIKSQCPYYGEPCGCNNPDGPQSCCDDLDDMVGELLDFRVSGLTPEQCQELGNWVYPLDATTSRSKADK